MEALYQAVLGRAMDDRGKQTYANALGNGWTLGQVREVIAHSPDGSDTGDAWHNGNRITLVEVVIAQQSLVKLPLVEHNLSCHEPPNGGGGPQFS